MPEGLDERNYGGKFNVVEIGDKMVVDFSEVYALNQNGYAFVSDTLDIPIQPLTLKVSGLTVADKVYDGTTSAVVSGEAKLEGVCESDEVFLMGTPVAEFENERDGKNKKVILSGLTLAGDSSVLVNYKLAMPEISATITAAESSSSAESIVYGRAKRVDQPSKIYFDGHSVIMKKNGMRFDLLGNKLK